MVEQGLTSPRTHIIGHTGDGFYRSNDPTDSVKALKEDMVFGTRLRSRQAHLTLLTILNI